MQEHEQTPEPTKWLHRIAKAPFAGVKVEDLPRVLDVSPEDASVIMADLINDGLVELWKAKGRICLKPEAAERINVVAVPDERGRITWQTRGSYAARPRHEFAQPKRRKKRKGETDVEEAKTILASDLAAEDRSLLNEVPADWSVDRESDEPDERTAAEIAEDRAVTVLYGLGMVWQGPSTYPEEGQSCKGCRHVKKMAENAVCLLCHRTGRRGLRIPPQPARPNAVLGLNRAPKPRKDDDDEPEPPRKRRKKLG